MSYEAYLSETFQKCIKILKKKYRRVKNDLYDAIQRLEEDPSIGDAIPGFICWQYILREKKKKFLKQR